MNDTESKVSHTYEPVFPRLLGSLKDYFALKAKELKFGTSNSVSELPYVLVNSIESRTLNDPDSYLPSQHSHNECMLVLTLYTDEANMAKYYDMIVNLLRGWAAQWDFIGLTIHRRTLYPIREEMGGYTVNLVTSITYQDFVADTTYPIVNEEDCISCSSAPGYPKLMRVDQVQVTVDKV